MNRRSVKEHRLLRRRRTVRPKRDRYYRPNAKIRGERAAMREFDRSFAILIKTMRSLEKFYASLMNCRFEGVVESINARMHASSTLPEGIDLVVERGPQAELFILDETQAAEEVN